jgi:long-chain acyl-CoA synthetase
MVKNILDSLEINKNTNPDKVAVICEDTSLTYTELFEYSDRLSNKLRTMGLTKGNIVALMFPNIVEFVVSYFAVLKAGGIVLPVNVIDKEENIKYVFDDAEVKYIIHWDRFKDMVDCILGKMKTQMITLGLGGKDLKEQLSYQFSATQMQEQFKRIDIEGNDISAILYTSGTTGYPKGAMHSYKNFAFVAKIWEEILSISPEDRFLAVLPLFHSFSQSVILNSSMWSGATLVLQPRLDIEKTIQIINQNNITLLFAVPAILEKFLSEYQKQKFEIPSVRLCLSGINACSEKIIKRFEETFKITVLESYGTAETLFISACDRINRIRKPYSVGFPIKEIEMEIVDENDSVLSTNDMGEILIRGENNMIGYINHPELTCRVLKKGWFYTGDIGMEDNDRLFFVIDKKFDVIKKGGFAVYPSEIESVIMENEKVKEVAIIGVPDETKIEEIKACVVLNEDANITEEDIINFCKERLPIYKCPKYIEFFKSLPKNSTGKILRKLLKS